MRDTSRREFMLMASAYAASAGTLAAKSGVDRSHVSAISDEIAASPEEAIAFAKHYRLEWLELRNEPSTKKPYFYMEPAELEPAAKAFADNGIRISFLNTSVLKAGLPSTEPLHKPEEPEARAERLARGQAEFDRRLEDLRKCIRAAHAFGTKNVRVFTFLRVAEPEKLYPRLAEILEPMAKIAGNEGVRLLIENETATNVGSCAETAAILKMLPRNVGTNWDALNGAAMHETPFPDGYDKLPKDRIWNIQFKGKSMLEASQRLPWSEIIHAVEQDGYTGELGLETHYFDGTNLEKSHLSMEAMLQIVGGLPS